MTQPTLHVLFDAFAADELRRALSQLGHDDRVVRLPDNLSFGPIDPPDPKLRQEWIEKYLGYKEPEDITAEIETFWEQALEPGKRRVVWVSRRSTLEFAGFLEFLWRLGDGPCDVVDLTDFVLAPPEREGRAMEPSLALTLALVPVPEILSHRLPDRAFPLEPEMQEIYKTRWSRLRAENSPLRALDKEGTLISVPLIFFDPLLLAQASGAWRKATLIIGRTLGKFWDDTFLQAGELVLSSRLRALVDGGRLEIRGDVSRLQGFEVRLPPGNLPDDLEACA
jgi:hypothetical protein